jgi:cell division protein FtsB
MTMVIVKVIAPVILFVTGMIHLALQEKWHHLHDRRTRKHRCVLGILVVLMVAALLVTCWTIWSDCRAFSQLRAQIGSLVKGNDRLLSENKRLQETLDRSTEQVVALSSANLQLSDHISGSITGGNSFCYYVVGLRGDTRNELVRFLVHVGEYALHDLNIRIVDGTKLRAALEAYDSVAPGSVADDAQTRSFVKRLPGAGQSAAAFPEHWATLPPGADSQTYTVFFTAQNGSWRQQVSLRRVSGRWRLATRVMTDGGKPLVPEEVSDEFPRDPNGAVLW